MSADVHGVNQQTGQLKDMNCSIQMWRTHSFKTTSLIQTNLRSEEWTSPELEPLNSSVVDLNLNKN